MSKRKILAAVAMVVLLLAAIIKDFTEPSDSANIIERPEVAEGEKSLSLRLDAGNVLKNYEYDLTVQPRKPSYDDAKESINKAKKEIDKEVFGQESANKVTNDLAIRTSYEDGQVEAEWSFSPAYYLDEEGNLYDVEIPTSGEVIEASVEMKCGDVKEIYSFDFCLYPKEKSEENALLDAIQREITKDSGESAELSLPESVNGVSLSWKNPKEYLTIKVLMFELLLVITFFIVKRENKKKEEAQRRDSLMEDYPDIVNNLAVLMGAGMTIRQAWNKISARYFDKRKKNRIKRREGYELLLLGCRELSDGESERNVYKLLGDRGNIREYRSLSRLLCQNLARGNKGIVPLLEKESENAFVARKQRALKLGEEAGTKMLFPLMMMLGVVLVIVMAPAMVGFIS